ncbi:MAG: malto-oligosyltrehalose trehalohydrolase [Burkholderiales bacterium]|nr:malto-oligosyltrehalose trehalohydrolase [Burkholderiales bacterium]
MSPVHHMPFGAELRADGTTRFRLWAPDVASVDLELEAAEGRTRRPMQRDADGWHAASARAGAGARYAYVVDDGLRVPDPASRFNPDDVHGASEVVDPLAYRWREAGWRGRPWHEAVVYELHVGTFTPEGTFAAAAARLPTLAALGVTAVELMPVADFPGARNWGYDGVLPFAPDARYGRPEDLKALIDAAHGLGLMALLDVVYNHFGPEGNYLHAYCKAFFNARHETPWGAAINFDGPGARTVRDFFIHNALYWIEEYRFDGLRLDAIHAIRDDSTPHIVNEIAQALHVGPGRERHVHLVLENDANQSRFLGRNAGNRPLAATAQWNDDVHHALHVPLTGEADGYYADYADRPLERLGRGLAEGFVYQGDASGFRGGEPRGEASAQLPPTAFVSFLQTHDQVGNRAFGERIHALSEPPRERAALAALLLSPHVPMLFMGEEWAAATPFQFFCDFGAELADAVTRGRREEFGRFAAFADPAVRARIPDPNAATTFQASKLNWAEREISPHRERLALVRELLDIRRREIVARLAGARTGGRFEAAGGVLCVDWPLAAGATLHLALNLSDAEATLPQAPAGRCLYRLAAHADGALRMGPCSVYVALEPGDE